MDFLCIAVNFNTERAVFPTGNLSKQRQRWSSDQGNGYAGTNKEGACIHLRRAAAWNPPWRLLTKELESTGNHRRQPWCGNSLLLEVVRGSLPSKSKSKIGETSVYPQPPDTRVVEGPKGSLLRTVVLPKRPPCLCCCSFPETPSPLQVPGSPQGVEASGEARAPVVA